MEKQKQRVKRVITRGPREGITIITKTVQFEEEVLAALKIYCRRHSRPLNLGLNYILKKELGMLEKE